MIQYSNEKLSFGRTFVLMFYLKLFKLEIKPITPSELILKKPITKNMELMVNTINELIIERFDGTQITIEKEDIIERFY